MGMKEIENTERLKKIQGSKPPRGSNRIHQLIIKTGIWTMVVGAILGGALGSSLERKASKKEMEKAVAQAKREEQMRIEELEKELEVRNAGNEADNVNEEKELPWYLTLVNESHPMKEGYVPELTEIEPNCSVDSRIAEPLREMLADAKADGMNIIICSAYRSVERQEQVFNSSVQDRLNMGMSYWDAYQDTALSVALPGTSEHGMGLSLDLISNQYTELDEKQAETKEAKWLEENCFKYGFILRYPPDKTAETGIIYEPWHYRYVGKEDAKKIMESGVTLERYLEENY